MALHITELEANQTVKVDIKPIYGMIPKVTRVSRIFVVESIKRPLKGTAITSAIGRVISNDPQAGTINLVIQRNIREDTFSAEIPYRAIQRIYLAETFETGKIETSNPLEPGGKALGTALLGGTLLQPRFNYTLIDM